MGEDYDSGDELAAIQSSMQQDDNPNNKIIAHLFDELSYRKDGIDLRTKLTQRQIADATKIVFLAKTMEIPELERFVVKFLRYKVSEDREGRKELIQAVTSVLESSKNEQFMQRMSGMFGK